MSSYENIVGGKLKLKGKPLDVKAGGLKKKKKHRKHYDRTSEILENELATGGTVDSTKEGEKESDRLEDERHAPSYDDHLTPAERRYIEQREKLDVRRLARIADKSHRDRIENFNQYLANMSEHYDIPKVGPG